MNLIISIDYELYGDGSGDVFKHMIKPTKKILDHCDKYNIKTTIFFEIVEYIKIKNEWKKGNTMGYKNNPIDAINKQLFSAIENDHDIQLHLHPQWVNAIFSNNRWEVDKNNWRLGSFSTLNNYNIYDLLFECKNTLESLIRQIKPDYKCIAIRAGGYNILPSKKVYDAMVKLDLKIDSSVYPGGYEKGKLNNYDYRKAKIDIDYWYVKPDNFSNENNISKVLEMPIFALPQRRYKKLSIKRIKSAFLNKKSAISSLNDKTSEKKIFEKVKWFFKKESFTWDFCLFDKKMHKYFFTFIKNNLKNKRNNFIIIGHPKGLTDIKTLQNLIHLSLQKEAKFITIKEFYDSITK